MMPPMPPDEPVEEPPVPDDELPPPPSDTPDQGRSYGELKVKNGGPVAAVRRAFVIFQKDLRTMAKHGLVGAIITFTLLSIGFYAASFTMEMVLSFDFGDGDDEGIPGASGVDPPSAAIDFIQGDSVEAYTTVQLDASGSIDDGAIVYYVWEFWDGVRDVSLFGERVQHEFIAVGSYEIHLAVVDDELNMNETMRPLEVMSATSDTQPPMADAGSSVSVGVGSPVSLDGTASSDNVEITDYIWRFYDGIERVLYGSVQSYTFDNAGYYEVELVVVDSAGNTGYSGLSVDVAPSTDDYTPPEARIDDVGQVSLGETVSIDGSDSFDDRGEISFVWYVSHNLTMETYFGSVLVFTPDEWGMYEVVLGVRDEAGNVAWTDTEVLVLPSWAEDLLVSWGSTPFGVDLSFNLLSYSYGIALLASVIYLGGLFAKGFAHEITKGTIKVLFSGPVSVTNIIFSKLLYPLLLGPLFIFPLVYIGLSRFGFPVGEVLLVTLVAYALVAVTMVAAAYGACMIYLAAKRMVVKPSALSRAFMYLSLVGTLTVFEWLSFLMDEWFRTDSWGDLYLQHGGTVAQFSPFHQGGVFLSNQLMGTGQAPDLLMLLIPIALIALGLVASKKLYTDIFTRE
jgi:hypothetical protein